jgi:hypothetical protein
MIGLVSKTLPSVQKTKAQRRDWSGEGPYAQTAAATALRSPNRIFRLAFPGAAIRLLFSSCGGRGMNEKRDEPIDRRPDLF